MSAQSGIPLDQVHNMKAQGYENNQIIESLQRDGFTSAQIFDALNQADMHPATDTYSQQQAPQPPQAPAASFPPPSESEQEYPYQEHLHPHGGSFEQTNTEELVEAIIDEKWNELVKDINTIIDWKNETENKIIAIEQNFNNLKDQFDKLHQSILGRVGEYDKHIQDVGAEVKAMEKVFSKVLPIFTENVHELSRITRRMGPEEEKKPEPRDF
ncbi:MAG: hypothetical protein ABIH41_04185 [Nanoarchaeota archaeon]